MIKKIMGGKMSNFSSFCKENGKKNQNYENKDIKQTYEELKGLGEDELSQKLFEEVKKQKQEGTFDYEGLAKNLEMMKAFLPNETYLNMKNLLEKIK